MNFSAFNRLGQVHQLLGSAPGARIPQRIQTGGAFSPNALETLYAIRSNMDEQWDEGFVVKYRTTMQNRLNNLAKQLRDAYSALMHSSTTQVVGEGIYRSAALDDAREDLSGLNYLKFGNGLGVDPYRRWGRDTDTDNDGVEDFDADIEDSSMPDADLSYRRDFFGASVEMRRLGANAAAMDQYNRVDVTMRSEEVPLESGWFADAMGAVGRFLGGGDPPFEGRQNVASYKADLPTGGFWSSLNYLYSFNPRQLKYTYATAYSINSQEAGTRATNLADQDSNAEGYIFQGKLVDRQDQAGDQFTNEGNRVKWSGASALEGYSTEKAAYTVNEDWLGNQTSLSSDWKLYNRLDGTEYSAATHELVKGTTVFIDKFGKEVVFKTDNPDGQNFSEANWNHVTVTKQSFEWNTDSVVGSDSTGSMTNDETIDVTAGIDGSAEYSLTRDEDGDPQITPSGGGGKIARGFTQKVFKEFFEVESYNGQEVLGNGPDLFAGNLELASYEGIERARAMSLGYMTAEQAGAPTALEINATPIVPTDWYFAEDRGGGSIWFPFVKNTIYGEPASPNDTHYKEQTAQFRKLISLTDEEYDDIPATGLVVTLTGDDQAYLMVNGEVMNLAGVPTVPNVPLAVTIPKDKLKRGDNMFGMQVDEYAGGEGVTLSVDAALNPAVPAATRSALDGRIATTNGAGSEAAEKANYWQSRVVPRQGGGTTYPLRSPATPPIYETDSFTLERTGTAAPVTNPLSVILMEAMNDPRYQDVFRLGLLQDLFVRGIANTPNGSTLTGTLLLNYDSAQRKLGLTQVKMTSRQGS